MRNKQENNSYEEELELKQNEASTVRKIVLITLGTLIIIMLIGVILGFFYIKSALEPVDSESEEEVEIEIPLGSSSYDIAWILEGNNMIKNSTVFKFFVKFKNKSEF